MRKKTSHMAADEKRTSRSSIIDGEVLLHL